LHTVRQYQIFKLSDPLFYIPYPAALSGPVVKTMQEYTLPLFAEYRINLRMHPIYRAFAEHYAVAAPV